MEEAKVVSPISLRCIATQLFTSERANRKIDKKHRFVKCRGRFGLLVVAARTRGRGCKRDSHSWVLTIVCRIYWDRFAQPFRRQSPSTESSLETLMPHNTRTGFLVFVSRTIGFVSRGISWAPQVCLCTLWLLVDRT